MGLMEAIQVDTNYAIVIDNWYSKEEYTQVLRECQFCADYLNDPVTSGSATKNGEVLKKNKAMFIGELFSSFNKSFIAKHSFKKYEESFISSCISIDPLYYYLENTNQHDLLISYYEESDYYKAHRDNGVLTMLTWIYEDPKAFNGGNLILKDSNDNVVEEIECISNRTVIFPPFMLHEVSPISMEEKDLNQKKGRFTISHFSAIGMGQ
jgi:Rps23 Pro-64 3,4-dihydroxylase Tpa1-like proline 4-hydroxylase